MKGRSHKRKILFEPGVNGNPPEKEYVPEHFSYHHWMDEAKKIKKVDPDPRKENPLKPEYTKMILRTATP